MTDTWRLVLLFTLAGVLFVSITVGTVAGQSAPDCSTVSYNGDGTEANPYEVGNVDQLQCVGDGETETRLNDSFVQTANIDASETSSWNTRDVFMELAIPGTVGVEEDEVELTRTPVEELLDTDGVDAELVDPKEGIVEVREDVEFFNITYRTENEISLGFEPIGDRHVGTRRSGFSGSFDGDGHTVDGLYMNHLRRVSVGLFSTVESGKIEKVVLKNVNITGGEGGTGGLAGLYLGNVTDSSVEGRVDGDISVGGLVGSLDGTVTRSSASVEVTGDFAGGLVGSTIEGSEISNSYASGEVDGRFNVGGLVGTNGGTVDTSNATGDVNGTEEVGGLIGSNSGSVIETSASGDVSGERDKVGGLIGESVFGTVERSNATGDVEGGSDVGGLIGYNEDVMVSESSAEGNVDGAGDRVGGLIGANTYDSTVNRSSASANVNGSEWVGGLVGANVDGGVVTESSAVGNVNGGSGTGGLVGLNGEVFSDGVVESSYARGDVEGDSSVGGVVGLNLGSVSQTYAVGSISVERDGIGGLVGQNGADAADRRTGSDGELRDSYWDVEKTGQNEAAGQEGGTFGKSIIEGEVDGLRTDEIQGSDASENMNTFNFTETWETVSDDYPKLAWQELPPTASFTFSPTNPTVGKAVTFDASGSSDSDGSIERYEWDYGDGNTASATGETASHSYSSTGTYTVTLTVTDDDDATDSATETVEVRDPSTSPIEGVSDDLWVAVTENDSEDGLSLADLGNAIQQYRANPGDAEVGGVDISLSDLGSLIQYYRNVVA